MTHDDEKQTDMDTDSAVTMNDEDLLESKMDEDTDMQNETSEDEPTRRKGGRSSGIADEPPDDQDETDWEEN